MPLPFDATFKDLVRRHPNHHSMRLHHAAVVGRFHTGHHWGADPATSTSFQVVAQFKNPPWSYLLRLLLPGVRE